VDADASQYVPLFVFDHRAAIHESGSGAGGEDCLRQQQLIMN